MPVDIRWLNDRYDRLYADAANFRNLWRQVSNYFRVNANSIESNSPQIPGQAMTNFIFDSTPIDCLEKLTSFVWSNIAPQSSKWFIPTFGEEELQQNDSLVDWIERQGDQLLKDFRVGGLYSILYQAIKDCLGYGTGAIFTDEKPIRDEGFQGFDFKCIPIGQYVIAENFAGEVDTLMRKFPLTAKTLAEFARKGRYGMKEATLPREISQEATQHPDRAFNILHAVFPRTDTQQKLKGPLGYPSASIYAWEDKILTEGGFPEFPYAVARFAVDSGEVWGRGLGFTGLPDAMQLNKQAEMRTKILAKIYAPPTIGRDGYIVDGDVQNFAGGHTRVSRDYMGPLQDAFTVLPTGENFQTMLLCEERLIASLQRIFFVDQIAALGATDNPEETATKSYIRWQLCHQMLGPSAGNLETGLLQGIIQRCFNIRFRAGGFEEAPGPLVPEGQANKAGNMKQSSMSIRFDSPFARAQRAGDVEAFSRWMARFSPLYEIYPEIKFIPDVPRAMRESSQIEGVPGSWVRDKDAVEEDLAQMKQDEQDAKAAAETTAAAEAGGKVAPLVKALPELQGMLGGQGMGGQEQ